MTCSSSYTFECYDFIEFGKKVLSIGRYIGFVPIFCDVAVGRKAEAMASVDRLHFYALADWFGRQ